MYSRHSLSLLAAAVALALPFTASAQDATELDEVLVTATRTEIAVRDSLAPAQVIGREEIERSQSASLQDLLRGRAGINLTNAGGLGKQSSLFLRGTNSAHTLVLVDGIRINSADLGLAMIQDMPLEQIERIEIVRGPQSSLYGADAIGGVIQIFTRRNPGQFLPHFRLGGGSNGLREASGGFGGTGQRGWFGTDVAYQRTDGFNACRASFSAGCYADEPDRDGYRNLSVSLRGGYALTDTLSVEGTALRAEGENQYDGYYNYSETEQQVIGGKLRYSPNSRFDLTASIGRADNKSDNFNGSTYLGSAQTHRDNASVQADVGVAEGQLLTAGVDWSQDNLDGSTAGYLVDSRDNTGVFLQYLGRFGQHSLQASVRNDDNEQFGNYATGSAAWGLQFGNGFKLTAGYGTAFKAPTFSDLYDPWSGVPTLAPEESRSANVGITQYGDTWHWGVDAYETRIDDLITYDSSTFMMAQVEKARIRGAELTGAIALAGFDIAAQISHTDPRNRTAGSAQFDNLLARRARNTARVDVDRAFGAFKVGLTANGASHRYDNAANSVRLAGYGTLDLRVEYAITPAWSVLARATNVFDHEYETVGWYRQAGREYGLSVRYQPRD